MPQHTSLHPGRRPSHKRKICFDQHIIKRDIVVREVDTDIFRPPRENVLKLYECSERPPFPAHRKLTRMNADDEMDVATRLGKLE